MITTARLHLLDGAYSVASNLTVPNIAVIGHGKPVVTRADGYPPGVFISAGASVKDTWFGGTKYSSEVGAVVIAKEGAVIDGCTFFGYSQCVVDSGLNNVYRNNRFVNCGFGGLSHDLYISGDTHPTITDNVFLGGQGYKIHLWHMAANCLIEGNFCAESYYEAVLSHTTQTAVDNIFWNHTPPTDSWLTVNLSAGSFSHNLFGNRTFGTGKWDTQMNGGADDLGLTVDRCGYIGDRYLDTTTWPGYEINVGPYNGDGHVLPAAGTNYTRHAVTDLPALLGYSEAEIDTAVDALITAFTQTTQQIHDDATIETSFAVLKGVIDTWKTSP